MDCAVSKPGDLRASHNVHASSVSGEDILVNFGRRVGAIYLERRAAGVHDGAPGKHDASEPAALGCNGYCAVVECEELRGIESTREPARGRISVDLEAIYSVMYFATTEFNGSAS